MFEAKKPLGQIVRSFILKNFGSKHSLFKFFIYLFVFLIGTVLGSTIFSLKAPPKLNTKIIQDNFYEMFREYIAEEDTKVFENFGDSNSQPIFRLDSKKVTGSYVHGMFVARSRPVIFKSQKIGKFPSPRLWTDEYLLRKFGNQKVKVQSSRSNEFSRYTQKEYSHFETMSFSKFLKNYNSPKRTSNYFLKEDVLKRHRFLTTVPKHLRIESELFKTGIEFQMGAGGQIGILSQANQEVFVCQIKGWRKVILYDPTQTDLLYPKRNIPLESQVNPVEPDLKKFPKFEKSKPVMGRLNAGECLFVPSNWWYFDILQKGKNIALTYIYLPHSLQYAKVFDSLRRSRNEDIHSFN